MKLLLCLVALQQLWIPSSQSYPFFRSSTASASRNSNNISSSISDHPKLISFLQANKRNDMSTSKSYAMEERQVDLETGVSMKVTYSTPTGHQNKKNRDKPILLFLHGSFHGGWCWVEHYFEYFFDRGYTVVAPCWRGTGGTFAGTGVKKVKIQEHVSDLESLMDQLPVLLQNDSSSSRQPTKRPVVLIAHSFASLAVMKLLEKHPQRCDDLSGIVTMCGVPPSGNGKMTMRYLRRSLVDSYKITVGLAMKKCITNANLCRELFFGGSSPEDIQTSQVSDQDIERYQAYFKRDTDATIDLMDLAKQLPSSTTIDEGRAAYYKDLPPCMVLGAQNDFIVDKEGVEETARYFNVGQPIFVDSPHDVMLTNQWKNAAQELEQWLDEVARKS